MKPYSIIILSFVYWLFNVSVALVIDNGSGNAEQFLRRNRRLGSYHILAASGCFSCISAALRQLYTCIGAWLGDSANQQRIWLQWNSRGAGSGAVASQQIVHDKYLQGQGPTRSSFQDETVCLQQILFIQQPKWRKTCWELICLRPPWAKLIPSPQLQRLPG